jgi:hypothetical protein
VSLPLLITWRIRSVTNGLTASSSCNSTW